MNCLLVIIIDPMNLVWEKLFLNMWAYLSQYVIKNVHQCHQFTIQSVCYKKCTSMSSIHNKNYIFMNVAENDDIFIIFLRIFTKLKKK